MQRPDCQQIAALPGAIAFWDFSESDGSCWNSKMGQSDYPLRIAGGHPQMVEEPLGGGRGLEFDGVQDYLVLPCEELGELNLAGPGAQVTVVAWLRWNRPQISFIAGIWQEHDHDPRRQYGLFIHLPAYGGSHGVCGHISKTGGASPGLPYSRDYSANVTPVPIGEPVVVAFSYDGQAIRSYLNGQFEPRPHYTEPGPPKGAGLSYAKNPYEFPDGMGDNGGDFTVGSVLLTAGMRNHFAGRLYALAVFNQALTETEIASLR